MEGKTQRKEEPDLRNTQRCVDRERERERELDTRRDLEKQEIELQRRESHTC